MLPKFDGPFVVTKVLDADRYVIEDIIGSCRSKKKYHGIIAVHDLKLYKGYMTDSEGESRSENGTGISDFEVKSPVGNNFPDTTSYRSCRGIE